MSLVKFWDAKKGEEIFINTELIVSLSSFTSATGEATTIALSNGREIQVGKALADVRIAIGLEE